jgi:hypothetical protein
VSGRDPEQAERLNEDDQAARTAELFRTAALAATPKPASKPLYTGWCANCETAVDEPALWCDTDCRVDFDRRAAAQQAGHAPPRRTWGF